MIEIFAGAFLLAYAAPGCGGHGDASTMLVSTDWLAAHLHDANLVILAVGDKADYERSHIPGAVHLPFQELSNRLSPLTLELPSMADLAGVFGRLGVTNNSRIVLYVSKDRVSQMTRAFLSLDAMGLGKQTSILDGGFPVWQKEGRAVTADVPSVKPGGVTPCAQTDVIVDSRYVVGNLGNRRVTVVDARLPEFYSGDQTATGRRPGHIPGAVNLPYTSLFDEHGKLWPADTLREMLARVGLQKGQQVVSYCHIGQQATVVYFVARYLGMDARLYDGSWEDWSAHQDLPAQTGSRN